MGLLQELRALCVRTNKRTGERLLGETTAERSWPGRLIAPEQKQVHFCDAGVSKTYCGLDRDKVAGYTWTRDLIGTVESMGYKDLICEGCLLHMTMVDLNNTKL